MENLIYGITVIIICLLLAAFGYQAHRKGNYPAVLFSIIIGGLLLRIFVCTDLYLHEWDERFHALVAKNMILHPLVPTLYNDPLLPYDYKSWVDNHIWLHKLPVPLWLMSFSMCLAGVNEIALRLPSLVLSSLGIYLVHYIGKSLFSRNIGFISAMLYAIHGLIIELSGGRVPTDHFDVHFMAFILFSVFFLIRFRESGKTYFNLLSGFFMGLALLSKFLPALIVIPVWLLLMFNSVMFNLRKILLHFLLFLTCGFFLFITWMVYIFTRFPQEASYEMYFNFLHLTRVIEGQSGSILFHFDKMRMNYGELVYLPVLWYAFYLFKPLNRLNKIAIFIWFLLPYLFFSLTKTKMQAYTLFAAPALFIITAVFYTYLTEFRAEKRKYKWPVIIIQILLIALPIRYSIERIKPFEKLDRSPAWADELRWLAKTLPDDEKTVLFNIDRPVETMFYINCTAYPFIPDKSFLEELIEKDYKIYINYPEAVSEEMLSIQGVEILKLNHN